MFRSSRKKPIKSRKFSERGFLEFSFDPMREGSVVSPIKITIPFYENPTISEFKQARLGKYKLLGRNSNLYSFQGADSKTLNLSFNFTLDHIIAHLESYSLDNFVSKNQKTSEYEKSRFFSTNADTPFTYLFNVIANYRTQYKDLLNENIDNNFDLNKPRGLYYFWVNVIRSSVIGTSDQKSPPPIVRLSFGPLYKRVPFLVEKYQIQVEDRLGYDVETLLPKRVKISLTMEEIRVGNFGKYKAYDGNSSGSTLDGENVAGWEYIMDTGSLDPLRSPPTSI